MRSFYAWLLLTISTFQWIGSHICFEVSYIIESQHFMNEAERAIAETVEEETGVASAVQILDEGQFTPRGLIYSNFFAFSTEIDEETVYYTISGDTGTVSYELVTQQQQVPQQENSDIVLLKGLYQVFTVPGFQFPISNTGDVRVSNFPHPDFHHQSSVSFLIQPPDDLA